MRDKINWEKLNDQERDALVYREWMLQPGERIIDDEGHPFLRSNKDEFTRWMLPYARCIASAFCVIYQAKAQGWRVGVQTNTNGMGVSKDLWLCNAENEEETTYVEAVADTPAEAICKCLLRLKGLNIHDQYSYSPPSAHA